MPNVIEIRGPLPTNLFFKIKTLIYILYFFVDFLITAHIYEQYSNLTPGDVTDLRSALVNNVTFASLAVRHKFHTYILHNSPAILAVIDNFVDFQQKNGHTISEEVFWCFYYFANLDFRLEGRF